MTRTAVLECARGTWRAPHRCRPLASFSCCRGWSTAKSSHYRKLQLAQAISLAINDLIPLGQTRHRPGCADFPLGVVRRFQRLFDARDFGSDGVAEFAEHVLEQHADHRLVFEWRLHKTASRSRATRAAGYRGH